MNKVCRSVYNKVLGSWVAASELTAAREVGRHARGGCSPCLDGPWTMHLWRFWTTA
ncbi:MAG: ESPR domain-containing protein [Paraburkholderia sp.]|nr:ESPR domain-containing protein [Paraburkholderia sp.]